MMRVPTSPFSLLGALLLATLGACADSGAAGRDLLDEQVPEAERYGGTLVIGIAADVTDVNPLTVQFVSGLHIQQHLLFLGLLAYDERFQPIPRLARSWELDEEAGTLTFHLRDDVFWHDGVRTTAHDMHFAYERARDPRTTYPYIAQLEHYGEAEVLDSLTWRVQLRPHWEYLEVWRYLPPMPRHLLEAVPPEELRRHPFSHSQPIGNGPFRFAERRPGERWIFEANPDFPTALGGRPYLDRVVFRVIPEPTTLLTELLTGGIDFYYQVPADQAARVERAPDAELLQAPGLLGLYLGFNHRRPPFDDVRVRRALTLGIDREQILATARGGYGRVANSSVAPAFAHFDAAAGRDLGYDPERARALLAAAGYRAPGSDGLLRDGGGNALRFTLKVPHGYPERQDAAQMIQASLRRIGVDVRLQTVEFSTLIAQMIDTERRDFDATIIGMNLGFQANDHPLFACSMRDHPRGSIGHCSPATDALRDSIMRISDAEAAKPLWSRYQHRFAEELPVTLLFFPDELHALRSRVRGARPDARAAWVGIERWWIHPARR